MDPGEAEVDEMDWVVPILDECFVALLDHYARIYTQTPWKHM